MGSLKILRALVFKISFQKGANFSIFFNHFIIYSTLERVVKDKKVGIRKAIAFSPCFFFAKSAINKSSELSSANLKIKSIGTTFMANLNISLIPIPGLPGFVADTATIGQGAAIPLKINYKNQITEFSAAKRTIEYTCSGLTGSQIAGLQDAVQNNLRNLLRRTDPASQTINMSGLIFEGAFIRSVLPNGSLSIESESLIDSTKITYETFGYSLV